MEPNYQFEGNVIVNFIMSTGSEINDDLYDGVGILLGTPVGGLK